MSESSHQPGPTSPRRRDRHGRGLRTALAPRDVPIARTRGETFEDLVLDAIEELELRWPRELAGLEFAVEAVPEVGSLRFSGDDPDAVVDRGVPLGRLIRTGADGGQSLPLVVVYRRPVEARAQDREERGDLVFSIVTELVATALGKQLD
jgi:hypothetical protein